MRGRRLLLEKPLPRAPSRRAAGNKLVFSFQLVRPCELGAFPCFGVMVTAADRAAATCHVEGRRFFYRQYRTNGLRGRRMNFSQMQWQIPPSRSLPKSGWEQLVFSFQLVRPCELGAFSCFGVMVTAADRAAATCQRRGAKVLPIFYRVHKKAANGQRPSAALNMPFPTPACPRRLCQPPWTHAPPSKSAHLSGGTTPEETYPSNANRSSGERGLGGEALLSEKRPLPQPFPFPHTASSGGGPGEGLLAEKPLPRSLSKNEYCSR